MSLVLRLPRDMYLCRSFKCPTPAIVFGCAKNRFAHLWQGGEHPCACHTNRGFNVQKWREHVVFCTFCLRNLLRATTAYIFLTSQLPKVLRGAEMCVVHVDFDICFAPQRCALFRHLIFQKCSEREVFLACSLAHVLRATTGCTFLTSQLLTVLRR